MTAQTQPEALRRVQAYIARLKQSQRIDRECISVFDSGAPSEVSLLTSDIEWMVAQLREKRQPLSDEQIKGVLEIVKTVIACVNEAHHAKSEGWRDGCFASADSAYSRIEPYLREIGIEEQS